VVTVGGEPLSELVCSVEAYIVPNDHMNVMCGPRMVLLAVQEDVFYLL